METGMPRALRMRPIDAAVMPLPSELVTPPVTKTYFGIGLKLRGFSDSIRARSRPRPMARLLGVRLPAVVRAIHPAPALAVTALSAALGAILLAQSGLPIGSSWALLVLSVAGSQ